MTDDLSKRVKKAADTLIAAGASEVYIFGSAVTGEMRHDSDIDLAVSGLPNEVFFQAMADLKSVLERPLDLIDLDEETPFTNYLKEEGELLSVG